VRRMTPSRPVRRLVLVLLVLAVVAPLGAVPHAGAAPEGTLTIAMHFTPVTRWLDPAEGESTITPYLLLYVLHDALLKPMPGVGSGPSLAESWSMSKDMLSADFTLRANVRFHDIMATAIPGFYMSPYEDLKLRRP
jgi:peptide/nickel transport system substrate-binding protein